MAPTGDAIRVLHVEDDPHFAGLAAELLERKGPGISVSTTGDAGEALDRLAAEAFHCVVSDYELAGMDGLELLEAVRAEDPDLPFILFTERGSEEVASEAIAAGVTDYLTKGSSPDRFAVLANRIRNAVRSYRTAVESARRQHRLDQVLKTVPACVVRVAPDGRFTFANDRAEEVLGIGAEGLRERTYDDPAWDITDPAGEPIPEEELPFRKVVETGAPVYGEHHTIAWPDGTRRHLRVNGAPLMGDDGAIESTLFALSDVTESREKEFELERYETLVETVGDPMYMLDAEGYIEMVNDVMLEYLGADEGDVVGTRIDAFMAEGNFERGTELIQELLEDPERQWGTFEMTAVTPDGEHIPAETNVGVLRDTSGRFRGSVGVVRNVTERRRRERQLERQNERLEAFAGVISHDLRNPLNVAKGHLDLLAEDHDSEYIEPIEYGLAEIETLLERVLSLARAGETVGPLEPVELAAAVDACREHLDGPATVVIDTERTVIADEVRLRELLTNLLQNAVAHGGEDVTVTVGDLPDGFFVEDDGPGIPSEDRESVLEPGYSTTHGSAGLGLSIVRDIAEAHGWAVTVAGGREGGARFEFTGSDEPA